MIFRALLILGCLTLPALGQQRLLDGNEPQAVANGNLIHLTFAQGEKIWITHSSDGGKNFSMPLDTMIRGEKIPVGMRRGPRVAALDHAAIISAIADGNVLVSKVDDDPEGPPRVVKLNDRENSAREGFSAIASDGRKNVFVVWLDDREGGKQIWGAGSHDGGETFSKNFRIYAAPGRSVCECCHVSVIFAAPQKIIVMFRNSIDGHRDMHLLQSDDGGKTFGPAQKLGSGTWKLNACPMDGGSLVADGGKIFTVWRRNDSIFECEAGQQEHLLDKGMQPTIGIIDHQPAIAWITHRNGALVLQQAGRMYRITEQATDPAIAGNWLFYEQNGQVWCRQLDSGR